MPFDPALAGASFVVGLLIGLTSMGGAALMTPILILFGGVRPALAVGTDLVYAAITKFLGAWMHWRQDTVDLRLALYLAAGSVPGGFLGVFAIRYLGRHGFDPDNFLRHGLGTVLMIVGGVILLRELVNGGKPGLRGAALRRWRMPMTIAWGGLVGFLVGLTSVGSGSLIVPFLLFLYPLTPAQVVGTDVFHAAVLVTATACLHWQAGNVDWNLVPSMLAGSLPGVALGCKIAPRLPQRALRIGLGLVMLGIALRLLHA